nr:hypothetical protein [Ruminococcus callidus]
MNIRLKTVFAQNAEQKKKQSKIQMAIMKFQTQVSFTGLQDL